MPDQIERKSSQVGQEWMARDGELVVPETLACKPPDYVQGWKALQQVLDVELPEEAINLRDFTSRSLFKGIFVGMDSLSNKINWFMKSEDDSRLDLAVYRMFQLEEGMKEDEEMRTGVIGVIEELKANMLGRENQVITSLTKGPNNPSDLEFIMSQMSSALSRLKWTYEISLEIWSTETSEAREISRARGGDGVEAQEAKINRFLGLSILMGLEGRVNHNRSGIYEFLELLADFSIFDSSKRYGDELKVIWQEREAMVARLMKKEEQESSRGVKLNLWEWLKQQLGVEEKQKRKNG